MSFLSRWAHELEHDVVTLGVAVGSEAKWVATHPREAAVAVGEGLYHGAGTVYNLAVGDDLKTVFDSKASTFDRVLAGVSLASNFVGPEGKLVDKGITTLIEQVAKNGGEELATKGIAALEGSLGKETMKVLIEKGGSVAEALEKGLDLAEKGLDRLNMARGVVDGAKKVIEDTKQTLEDVRAALKAAPADRAAAWERVAKDVAAVVGDGVTTVAAAKKSLDTVRPATLATLQNRAEGTLLQDAERIKAEGRTFVQGDTLLIDVRDSKNFQTKTMTKLETLAEQAENDGRTMVVFDPNVSKEQTAALLAKGISVAKSETELKALSLASRAPHGIELVNLSATVQNNDLFRAANERRETNEVRNAIGNAKSDITGTSHPEAKPWDGKAQWEGRITAADKDGSLEISVGRGAYVTFDPEQATKLGLTQANATVGSYIDIARTGAGSELQAAVAPTREALPVNHPDQHVGANR
jgi:hypothetical protein